jgi:hypothetical protein
VCFSGLPLFRKRLLRLDGLLSFFSESCFDGGKPSLQIIYSRLCRGSFALFLLECRLLRPFASALLFGSAARGSGFRSARLRIRRSGCCAAILAASFCVNQTL